ncbi:hypothetical protein GOBAR_AA08490 [Gossypium barbadense]|uniref:Uncharacterized protein n=1 Tax=Gossypium barbadense TaxID=3634 RepID=A0A2P5Y9A0_GOSBA|nr:hypothetical protein GOBAR_AA08490 [Gossypium barbadense]
MYDLMSASVKKGTSTLLKCTISCFYAVDASLNIRNNCKNKDLCVENLSLVLRDRPPYVPREFDLCAVAGNSGDHLKTRFGKERDSYENHTEYVGKKSTIRLLNRESARGLDKVVGLDATRKEVLIIKTTIHDFYESNDSG